MNVETFKRYIPDFLTYIKVEKNLSAHTLRAYESDLEQLVHFWATAEAKEGVELNPQTIIDRFFVALYHKKIGKASIARKISCFQSLQKFMKKRHDVSLDMKLQRPRLDKKLPVYLSIDEIFYLLDEVSSEQLKSPFPLRDKAVLELLYATGIRCSELIAIKMQDINFTTEEILIQGKGRKERVVLFGERCKKRLFDYITQERPAIAHKQEHLFLNYKQEPLTTRSIQRICSLFKACLQVKRNLTPHKLRHSFATHLLHQGADLRTVQELLGHKTLASTEKYTHVSLEQLSKLCATQHPLGSKKIA